ncbi:MAG: Cna B-type domain-containing protein, partial [Ruminococcus sp.]|nr:Cna B-type domain-containing protein [Ruminococcus sp.]
FPSNGIYAYNAESPSSVLSDLKCGGTAIDSSAVKFSADESGKVTMIFPEIENLLKGSTVEYTYALKLDPKKVVASVTSNVDSDNTALLYSSVNNEKVNTNSDNTAYANIEKPVLNKTGETDMTNKVVNWTITVDPKVLGGGDTSKWYILDKPGQNLTVDEVLEGISAAAPSAVKDGDSVKVNISDFTKNTDGSYTLTYSTAIPDEILEIPVNTNIGNSFEMHFGDIILQGGTGSGNINNSGKIGDDYKFTKEVDHVENGVIWWKVNLAIPDTDKLTSINVRDAWENDYILDTKVNINMSFEGGIENLQFSVDGTSIPAEEMTPRLSNIQNNGRSLSFDITDREFLTANRGKTLTVLIPLEMLGDETDIYGNTANVNYNFPAGTVSPNQQQAIKKPKLSIKKIFADNGRTYNYDANSDFNHTLFWFLKIQNEEDFEAGQEISIHDILPEGYEYVPDSAYYGGVDKTSPGYSDNYGYFAWEYEGATSHDADYTTFGKVTAAKSPNAVDFSFTIDAETAEKLNSDCGHKIIVGYAIKMSDEAAFKFDFEGVSKKFKNTAELSLNGEKQSSASNDKDVNPKKDFIEKSHVMGGGAKSNFTINVNKDCRKLSTDGKIFVDDWLGGDMEFLSPITINDKQYKLIDIDNNENDKLYAHLESVDDGTLLEGASIIRAGTGKKLSLPLEDETHYVIKYSASVNQVKGSVHFSPQEEKARYGNTAVVRNSDGDSASVFEQLSSSEYKNNFTASAAGTKAGFIIFNFEKEWNDNNTSKTGRPNSITLVIERKDLKDPSAEPVISEETITLNDNAVEQNGKWVFALKLPAYEVQAGQTIHKYEYKINEKPLEDYQIVWGGDDLKEGVSVSDEIIKAKSGGVVNSTLTNTKIIPDTIKVGKTDITGQKNVRGATLRIISDDENIKWGAVLDGNSDVTAVTNSEGKVIGIQWISDGTDKEIKYLSSGDYILREFGGAFKSGTTEYSIVTSDLNFKISNGKLIDSSVSSDVLKPAADPNADSGYYLYDQSNRKITVCDAEAEVTDVTISKKAATGTDELPGAQVELICAGYDWSDILAADTDISLNEDGTGITWKSGTAPKTFTLKTGTYTLKETGAPNGYAYAEDIEFTVTNDHTVKINGEELSDTTVVMKDNAVGIKISKRDAGGQELPDAELSLYRTTDADGKPLAEEVLVKSWTSGSTPLTISEGVIAGASYRLKEDTEPAGYKKASDITFTLDKYNNIKDVTGGDYDAETGAVVMIDYDAEKGKAEISKTSLNSSELIGGAELAVYKAEDIGADGKPLAGKTAVAAWTSEKGKTNTLGDLDPGDYVLIEVKAPDGYVIAENVPFTVTASAEPVQVTMKDNTTKVTISKTDITGDNEIADAELRVLDSEGNVIDSWKSEAGKKHEINGVLKAGETYTLHEEGAPDGYAYAEDIEFTVNADGSVTEVTMKDDVTKVKISKTDITGGKEIPGAELQVIDKNGTVIDSWTSEEGKSHEINGVLKAGETYT